MSQHIDTARAHLEPLIEPALALIKRSFPHGGVLPYKSLRSVFLNSFSEISKCDYQRRCIYSEHMISLLADYHFLEKVGEHNYRLVSENKTTKDCKPHLPDGWKENGWNDGDFYWLQSRTSSSSSSSSSPPPPASTTVSNVKSEVDAKDLKINELNAELERKSKLLDDFHENISNVNVVLKQMNSEMKLLMQQMTTELRIAKTEIQSLTIKFEGMQNIVCEMQRSERK